MGLQSSAGSLNALIFTFLASLCLFSFLVCVLTDPGGVPPAYVPDFEASEATDQALMKSVRILIGILGLLRWRNDFVDTHLCYWLKVLTSMYVVFGSSCSWLVVLKIIIYPKK